MSRRYHNKNRGCDETHAQNPSICAISRIPHHCFAFFLPLCLSSPRSRLMIRFGRPLLPRSHKGKTRAIAIAAKWASRPLSYPQTNNSHFTVTNSVYRREESFFTMEGMWRWGHEGRRPLYRLGTSSVIGIGFSFPSSQTQTATFRIREGINSHASRVGVSVSSMH